MTKNDVESCMMSRDTGIAIRRTVSATPNCHGLPHPQEAKKTAPGILPGSGFIVKLIFSQQAILLLRPVLLHL